MKKYPDQWDALTALIEKHQPKKIGINTSESFAHADGIDHTEYETLLKSYQQQ